MGALYFPERILKIIYHSLYASRGTDILYIVKYWYNMKCPLWWRRNIYINVYSYAMERWWNGFVKSSTIRCVLCMRLLLQTVNFWYTITCPSIWRHNIYNNLCAFRSGKRFEEYWSPKLWYTSLHICEKWLNFWLANIYHHLLSGLVALVGNHWQNYMIILMPLSMQLL